MLADWHPHTSSECGVLSTDYESHIVEWRGIGGSTLESQKNLFGKESSKLSAEIGAQRDIAASNRSG